VTGSRLGAFPLVATLGLGLGLALTGCGGSSPAASGPATASAPAATASAATPTASTATSPAVSGTQACPSAATVSAAAGVTYLPPTAKTASGALSCTYKTNSAAFLLISFQKASYPASALKQVAASAVSSQPGLKASPVSGIGDGAYLFTSKATATKPSGSELLLETGSREIIIAGAGNIGQIKPIARVAIAS
jgi:hypothetical protein